MKNLEKLFPKQAEMAHKIIIAGFLLISFVGFIDAAYLSAKHYLGEPVVCSILDGCEKVTTSQYSSIFGIPVALLGVVYYLIIFLLSIAYLDTRKAGILKIIAYATIVGFLASLWFLYLQFFVLKAFCFYCIISAITSTLLFVLGMIWLRARH